MPKRKEYIGLLASAVLVLNWKRGLFGISFPETLFLPMCDAVFVRIEPNLVCTDISDQRLHFLNFLLGLYPFVFATALLLAILLLRQLLSAFNIKNFGYVESARTFVYILVWVAVASFAGPMNLGFYETTDYRVSALPVSVVFLLITILWIVAFMSSLFCVFDPAPFDKAVRKRKVR